ncbi:uncharacterized protein LOC132262511 [Phlebotomus argentipes]|uniref:uncharacterized protein LOC132262511 n=1 Tax=Phlebotomus argentipes TaxID=94469 RepID=UPI002892C30A|nr:uncharacterized protein LOC132262511 [Phlebotomus argentipes]
MSEISEWFVNDNIFEACKVEILPKTSIELNLLSKICRLKIISTDLPEESVYLFVKTLIDGDLCEDVEVEKIRYCFEREVKVYREFLNDLPKSVGRISPRMIETDCQHRIVLEDLSVLGYRSQRKFLNLVQSECVFEQMATLHALSLHHSVVHREFTEFSNTICERFTPTLRLMESCARVFLAELRTWEGFSVYADKVENFLPHYAEVLARETEANPPGLGFNVLCHGDLHIGNVMIEENTHNIAMVDYQFSAWRSPAYDFFSAFNALCNAEVNLNSRNHLVKVYHRKFERTLKDSDYPGRIPTLLDIHVELLRHGFLDFFNWIYYLPLLLRYAHDDEDLKTKFKKSLQDTEYRMIVMTLLPSLIDKGFLEVDREQ